MRAPPLRPAGLAFLASIATLAAGAAGSSWPALAADPKPAVATSNSLLGNYLAGRIARNLHDTDAAADFYTKALGRDPADDTLLTQSFDMEATAGNWPAAEKLAERITKDRPDHRMARVFMGLAEFKRGRFAEADEHLKVAAVNPIGELTSNIARAWIKQAEGKTKDAVELLEQPKQPDWAQLFYRYHKALLVDAAGQRAEAKAAYERIYKGDNRSLRLSLAYAQHAANGGDIKFAQSVLQQNLDRNKGDAHPMARALLAQIESGERPPLLVMTASEGLAETFYGLGEALTGEGGLGPGAMFLQFALYLEPKLPFALATLANVYESTRKYDLANAAYDRVPKGTPLESAIEIRKALNLNALDRVGEAQALLETVAKRDPADIKPLDALGSVMRGHKRYEEAIGYYTRAIALIAKPDARHWQYYYSRATCYERTKRWPQAEADLQLAMKLSPDQSIVLNYLGYSWIDQNKNLKQGMALIEKAVKLKPDDGYIVDSLGWAHFRQGNFKEAVKWLERAVELRPEDPVLNDHLGDAFWRIGREREARFQWEQALTLKPEPEDADKISKKLTAGLPALAQARQTRPTKQVQRPEFQKKRTEARPGASPSVQ